MSRQQETRPPTYTDRMITFVESSAAPCDIKAGAVSLIKQFRSHVVNEYKDRMVDIDHEVLYYGQYKGRTIEQVIAFDRPYIEWASKQSFVAKHPEHLALLLEALE